MERKAKKDEKLRRKREDAESGEGAEEGGAGGDTAIEGMISAEDAEALGLRMPPPPAGPPKA